jgi:hypothetical protein
VKVGRNRKLPEEASINPNAYGDNFFAICGMPFARSQTVQNFSCEVKRIGQDYPSIGAKSPKVDSLQLRAACTGCLKFLLPLRGGAAIMDALAAHPVRRLVAKPAQFIWRQMSPPGPLQCLPPSDAQDRQTDNRDGDSLSQAD